MTFRDFINEDVTDASLNYALEKIRAYGKPDADMISNSLYNAFTSKGDIIQTADRYRANWQRYEGIYQNIWEQMPEPPGVKKTIGTQFVQFDPADIPIRPRNRIPDGPKITYKAYYTWHPDQSGGIDGVWSQIKKFVSLIPNLAVQLAATGKRLQDPIQFKVPFSLFYLQKHPDTVVVYFRNPQNRQEIDQQIKGFMSQNGLQIGKRDVRSERGYDFSWGSGHAKSHTELTTNLIARQMVSHFQQIMAMPTAEQIRWLKTQMQAASKIGPDAMHVNLYGKP